MDLVTTFTNNIGTLGVIVLGGYLAVKLFEDFQVRSTVSKIVRWSEDDNQVRHLAGHESFKQWLVSLPDAALEDSSRLAKEAAIGANIELRGSLSAASVARVGLRLQETWSHRIRIEKDRRHSQRNT